MPESRMAALREVVGMSVWWMVFAPRKSAKVWPWYRMVSWRSWKCLVNLEGHRWEMGGSNKDRVEYEPRTNF